MKNDLPSQVHLASLKLCTLPLMMPALDLQDGIPTQTTLEYMDPLVPMGL